MADKMTLEQLVTFCILMENHEGIVGKAPSYLFEKWEYISMTTSQEWLRGMLDAKNAAKFDEYMKRWKIRKQAEED
jgi:hypothetical protein